ncbi:MAG: transcriptional repressor [Actinomycetota bacterium]|nr:transcriptional repressor [Actinomycetota bacterium]MDQ3681059.1 transcriptional repressor [Actinomycetota bacterium]
MDTARLERILEMFRDGGGRVTTPRRAIITALLESGGHVTADELTATVQSAHPDVHTSTIYRCLGSLEQLGVVDHVHLGHGRAVYHLADESHQHLVCESCGTVVEVPDVAFTALANGLRKQFGFRVSPRHFAVSGRCRSCAR